MFAILSVGLPFGLLDCFSLIRGAHEVYNRGLVCFLFSPVVTKFLSKDKNPQNDFNAFLKHIKMLDSTDQENMKTSPEINYEIKTLTKKLP